MSSSATLADVTLWKQWLDAFRPLPPDVVQEIDHLYDVRLTYHSNAIEGNTLTQSETEMVLEKGITIGGKPLSHHLEAIGHRDALQFVRELATVGSLPTERDVRDLHNLLLRGIEHDSAGLYRTLDVRAAGTAHVYPSHLHVPELMQDFTTWMLDTRESMHPVLFASEAHYRFVSIHPFRDGNGRIGRLIMNLLLLSSGYPPAVLAVEDRPRYIDALVSAQRDKSDLGPLESLVNEAVAKSLIDYLKVLSAAESALAKDKPFFPELIQLVGSA